MGLAFRVGNVPKLPRQTRAYTETRRKSALCAAQAASSAAARTSPAARAARGEEAFQVERDDQDRVWFRATAFSVLARWPMVLAGPIAILLQRAYARLCGRALKRVCAPSRTVGS